MWKSLPIGGLGISISGQTLDKHSVLGLFRRLRHFNTRDEFLHWFFKEPEHAWMNSNSYIKIHFMDFFETVPLKIINTLFAENNILFVPSSGKFSCSVNSGRHVIIVFPELMQLLNAPFDGDAKAILSHELGHIYFKHSEKMIEPMEAQVEADSFAIQLGYADQLANFLEEQPESVEKRLRLTYCTSVIMSQ